MPQNNLENLKVRLLRRVAQERGSSFVHRQSLWSAVGGDITDIKEPAGSVSPFAKECGEDTATTAPPPPLSLVKLSSCF